MTCATHHRLLRAPQTQRAMKSAQRAVPRPQRRAFRRGPTSSTTPRGICDSVRAPRWPWLLDLGWWLGRRGSEGRDCAEGLHGFGNRRSGSGRQSSSWMRAGRESREGWIWMRGWGARRARVILGNVIWDGSVCSHRRHSTECAIRGCDGAYSECCGRVRDHGI